MKHPHPPSDLIRPRLKALAFLMGLLSGTIGFWNGDADGAIPSKEKISSHPNVLLLMTDQQTLKAMSGADNPYLHTPHMDELARKGTRFAISYCTSPVCGPARSSIITGRMPHETGVNLNNETPHPDIPNLGQIFREAGYETAWTGKWHLPKSYPRPPSNIPGFAYLPVPEGTGFTLGDQTDAAVTDQAVAFLKRDHDRPWLLAVSLHNPHDICLRVRDQPLPSLNSHLFPPLPANFAISKQEPQFLTDCREPKRYGVEQQYTQDWDDMQWRHYLYTYYRLTEQVDRCLGRILNTLRIRNLQDDTLIVFTSDHGEGMAEHQLIVKLTPYDGATTVPLTFTWPGHIPAGHTEAEHPVSAIDIVPTLCDYAGVSAPQVTGLSLRSWMGGTQGPAREAVVCEVLPFRNQPERMGRVLRTRDFKYICFTDGARPEMLFDMKRDPGETRNLVLNENPQAELNRHRILLQEWLQQTKDPFRAAWMK